MSSEDVSKMSRNRWWTVLGVLGVLGAVGVLALVGLVTRYASQLVEASRERELFPEEVRPAFHRITGRRLPTRADDLRAIYEGGTDPGIFVRFDTDSDGVAYVIETFSGRRTTCTVFDANDLRRMTRSGSNIFRRPSYWQLELGVCLFDQDSIESARVLESGPFLGVRYKILIDDQRNRVYMHAYRL